MKKYLTIFILILFWISSEAQKTFSIDASSVDTVIKTGMLRMGNPGLPGKELRVNNRYMTLNGKPIIPVMGEVHFSRIPRSQWEDVILKMKACGINIIATYVLWIHHEEIEGQFDWEGNKDFRAFVKLCASHDLLVYPRIGPWCHAEVRNGGTPDWILLKTNIKDRSNDPVYQNYAEEWYRQIGLQLKGLLYKDGGPVIGIQLENEYRLGKEGEEHILWLKKTALRNGLDVPLYTVTGWQNGSVPPYEVIPLFGAYPDEPWADNLNRNTDCKNFQFSPYRDSDNIGNDIKTGREPYLDLSAYPYFTCEVGVGIENTDHRRLKIGSLDGLGLIMAKIGSGSNLAGYYMFAGGTNPNGLLTSLEENREETGYYNTNPLTSYDFQAAIRESGELNDCYFEVKKLHYFLNEFGNLLAPMVPVFEKKDEDLQYCVRTDNHSAFLFGLNYCRHNVMSEKKEVRFSIKLKSETLVFPSTPVTIKDSALFIWPVNFRMGSTLLNYATAQPLCNIGDKWIFEQDADDNPEFSFDGSTITKISSSTGTIRRKEGKYVISGLRPGMNCQINIMDKNNIDQTIVVLSKEEAREAWLLKSDEKKYFFISNANMYFNKELLHAYSKSNSVKIYQLIDGQRSDHIFTSLAQTLPDKTLEIQVNELKPLEGASWLKTSAVNKLDSSNMLRHRFFVKEFSLGNPSKIRNARLIIANQTAFRLQINNIWVNQSVRSDTLNNLDLTGYVQKGENKLMLDFPFVTGQKAFSAKIVVEYFNTDQIEIPTDESWLVKDDYVFPSYFSKEEGFKCPEIIHAVEKLNYLDNSKRGYSLNLPNNFLSGLGNLILKIDYAGDKARMYLNHRLIADDFNNGTTWNIGLNRLEYGFENQPLRLDIHPLANQSRIYFDNYPARKAGEVAKLISIHLVPEYQFDFNLNGGNLTYIKP